jgi:hypothetical protein
MGECKCKFRFKQRVCCSTIIVLLFSPPGAAAKCIVEVVRSEFALFWSDVWFEVFVVCFQVCGGKVSVC